MPNIPNITSPLLPPLQSAGQSVHGVFPSVPVIPPNGTQDLLSKGLQKVRELLNHQRSLPPPTEAEMKKRQQVIMRPIQGTSSSGSNSEIPGEFDTSLDINSQSIESVDIPAVGDPIVTNRNTTHKQTYTSPSDRIDRDLSLIDTATGKSVKFPFVPRELKYTPESNFKAIASMGRNNPLYHFTGGEDTLEFEIDWYAEKDHRYDVILNCKWVESLSKNDSYENPPPPVILHWNVDLFADSLWLVTAAPYRLLDFQAHRNMLPQQAYQQITLKRIRETNSKRSDIQSVSF